MLVITNENIYNVSGKSIKRKISLGKLWGITVSKMSFEFILHIPTEYDYRYKSQENRDIMI
jgi:serum/glucocorticoid-regulated kinase 2